MQPRGSCTVLLSEPSARIGCYYDVMFVFRALRRGCGGRICTKHRDASSSVSGFDALCLKDR